VTHLPSNEGIGKGTIFEKNSCAAKFSTSINLRRRYIFMPANNKYSLFILKTV
jgi:hypothetical protein